MFLLIMKNAPQNLRGERGIQIIIHKPAIVRLLIVDKVVLPVFLPSRLKAPSQVDRLH
jgi:hypothetical protein